MSTFGKNMSYWLSRMPGSTIPSSTMPGSTMPSSTVPNSTMPSSTLLYETGKIKVCLVKDTPLGEEVIVKQVMCASEEQVGRVLTEGRMSQDSEHDNICRCTEAVREKGPDGQLYVFLMMPLMPTDLQKETQRRSSDPREPWPEPKLWEITIELVSALAFLQRKGIAHRDIKPENILLDSSGKVKICDFGFAKDIDLKILQSYTLLGTIPYFSPILRRAYIAGEEERKRVQHNVFKSDVYSLGVTLLHMMRLEYSARLTDLRALQRTIDTLLSEIQGYSPAFIEVVWRMLRVEEDFRPDFIRLDDEFKHHLPFADDERITQEPASASLPEGLEFSAKCGLSQVRVCGTLQEEVPCMVHVKAPTADLETLMKLRKGVDFVCIIDTSGSMSGSVIRLVQETLKRLTELLKDVDRLSIVTFNDRAQRICPLTVCHPEGKARLLSQIANLKTSGNTNIIAGFQMGVDTVLQRRYRNQVTTLLLLSDGRDTTGRNVVAECEASLQQIISDQTVTVHTLGYGNQIDSELLIRLANNGRGALYPVQSEEHMRKAFAMILGSVTSVVAKEIEIRLRVKEGVVPVPCQISKIYAKELDGDYYYLPEITANQTKNFIFLLKPATMLLTKATKFAAVIADIKYQESDGVLSEPTHEFQIKFVPWEGAAEAVRDPSVYVNWNRVMGADSLRDAKRLADQGRFPEADRRLSNALELLGASGFQDHPIVATVIRDIKEAQNLIRSDTTWNQGGAAHFSSVSYTHYSENGLQYASPQQRSYISQFSTLASIPEAEESKSHKK